MQNVLGLLIAHTGVGQIARAINAFEVMFRVRC